MSKRKILSLTLGLCMVAILAVGGTLAYFTDTDEATNTFTVGGVAIKLIEQQRNDEATALEAFEQDKVLMPLVGSAQGEKETVGGVTGLPTAENYVDKIITVKNTGKSDAYVRVFMALPVVLDNVGDASQNILHFNWNPDSTAAGEWTAEECVAENVTVDGVLCNVYSRIYTTKLITEAELKDGEEGIVETATPAYIGFYLDSGVDMNEDGQYTINGEVINMDLTKGISIPVFVQGIQTEGFETAVEAFDKGGLPTNPWAV